MDEKDLEYESVIKELSEMWDVENILKFNETDIQEKLSDNSARIYHFTELYHKEQNSLDKILELKEQTICERYTHYKKGQLSLKQSEIEKYYIPKDPYVMKLTEIARKQKWRVDFYLGLKQALEKQQWNMTTFLKSIQAGL